jgi:hypothetical protein
MSPSTTEITLPNPAPGCGSGGVIVNSKSPGAAQAPCALKTLSAMTTPKTREPRLIDATLLLLIRAPVSPKAGTPADFQGGPFPYGTRVFDSTIPA